MLEIRFARRAQADLIGIYELIGRERPDTAEEFLAAFYQVVLKYKSFSKTGSGTKFSTPGWSSYASSGPIRKLVGFL
jgi:plasmid stabilization system protein ParE